MNKDQVKWRHICILGPIKMIADVLNPIWDHKTEYSAHSFQRYMEVEWRLRRPIQYGGKHDGQ